MTYNYNITVQSVVIINYNKNGRATNIETMQRKIKKIIGMNTIEERSKANLSARDESVG
jgi:hypothetical protein